MFLNHISSGMLSGLMPNYVTRLCWVPDHGNATGNKVGNEPKLTDLLEALQIATSSPQSTTDK